MRTLSTAAREAMFSESTDECMVVLLELQFDTVIRVVNNSEDVVSLTETYQAYDFKITMPEERDDRISKVNLEISNVDPSLMEALSALEEPVNIIMQLVLLSDPDEIEAGPFSFKLINISFDSQIITGTLAFEDILNESYPGHRVTPGTHPAAF